MVMKSQKCFLAWVIGMMTSLLLVAPEVIAKPGKVINSRYRLHIEFGPGRTDVKGANDADIQQVTNNLKEYPYTKCEIRGYTDNVGSDDVNLKLSQERAESVRQYMIQKYGISPLRIT